MTHEHVQAGQGAFAGSAETVSPSRPFLAHAGLRLTIEYRSTDSLRPADRLVRRHPKKQIEALKASVTRFGCIHPFLVDKNGVLIAGHAVFEACRALGMDKVPVVMVEHLAPHEVSAVSLALNRLAEMGEWDQNALRLELAALCEIDIDLAAATGFELPEIDLILGAAGAEADPADEVVSPDAGPPVSRAGDTWLFEGGHRLLCGDARDLDAMKRLMADDPGFTDLAAGEKAQMVFMDPPFGCPIQGHVSGLGRAKHGEFIMGAAGTSEAELEALLSQAFANAAAVSADGSIHFVCTDRGAMWAMMQAGRRAYTELKALCVWDKGKGGMGSLYRQQCEFVLVFKSGRAKHINNIALGIHGRCRTTVWDYPGLAQFGPGRDEALACHPTVKPTALVMDAILDCSERGAIVLDGFAGSGTTIIAAHRTGRRARALELDPKYVDVAVKRAEAAGIPARHAETGLSFAELAQRRRGAGGEEPGKAQTAPPPARPRARSRAAAAA